MLHAQSQTKALRLELFQGMNKPLANGAWAETRMGNSFMVGLSCILQDKKTNISFEPMLVIGRNSYRARITDDLSVKLAQTGVNFTGLAGIGIATGFRLKTGFFVQQMGASVIRTILRSGSSYESFGVSEFYQNYHPRRFQAGVAAGLSVPFGEMERICFNLLVQYYATSFIATDYRLPVLSTLKQDGLVFSDKLRPVAVLAGLNFQFPRSPKRTEE